MSDDDNELVEYQTETPPDPEPLSTLGVHVESIDAPVVTIPTVPQHVSAYTVVVDADGDETFAEILPQDPLRTRALIIVNDQPVVLCHSQNQAQDNANTVTNVPRPNGAYIPASATLSTPVEVTSTGRLWAAATSTTPARISVLVERRSAP